MRLLVETTGAFQLLDPYSGALVPAGRPAVVPQSHFVGHQASIGQLAILRDGLPDDAEDGEFAAYWRDSRGDRALAVASYLSSFDAEPEAPPRPPRRAAGRKDPAEAPA